METILSSQPASYWPLIGRSFKLYRASFSKIILPTFLLALIVFIPRIISDIIGQDLFMNLDPLSPYRLWLPLLNLFGLIFFIAIIWHMHCVIRKVHEPLIQDFEMGLRKVLYVFLATLIQSFLISTVAIIFLGIQILLYQHHVIFDKNLSSIVITFAIFFIQLTLIVYIWTLFIFLLPLIATENQGIITSLERSASFVWNHWWRVFSVQITPWICYLFLLIVIRFLLNINVHIYFMEYTSHSAWETLLNFIFFMLFIPWVAALMLVQLRDLELRKKLASEKK